MHSPRNKEIPMKEIIRLSDKLLSDQEIISWLEELRKNSDVAESHFAVSAIIETLQQDKYVYIAGVNVENPDHNRLSLHAEQTAMSGMQALFGKNSQISKIWVMGAPDSAAKGDKSKPTTPCGACRQILMAFSQKDTQVYAVTLDEIIHIEFTMPESLPNTFDESTLGVNSKDAKPETVHASSALDLFEINESLTQEQYCIYLRLLKPRIIENQYRTSPIVSTILKLKNGAHAPGVLVEDIGFLTTDAVFAALGSATVRFGAKKEVSIAEIHLCGDKENITDAELLRSAEIAWLKQFADPTTPVFYYLNQGKTTKAIHTTTLDKCAQSIYTKDFSRISDEKTESPPYVVGISGASGSGKTTLAKQITQKFAPGEVTLIPVDNYYKDQTHIDPSERLKTNYDHPDSIDWALLQNHIQLLLQGKTIEMPEYSFEENNRLKSTKMIKPGRVIILESILLFVAPEIRKLLNLRLFVDTSSDIACLRRAQRDTTERGRTLTSVSTQYLTTVRPANKSFIKPSKDYAHIIINGTHDTAVAVEMITAAIKAKLTPKEANAVLSPLPASQQPIYKKRPTPLDGGRAPFFEEQHSGAKAGRQRKHHHAKGAATLATVPTNSKG